MTMHPPFNRTAEAPGRDLPASSRASGIEPSQTHARIESLLAAYPRLSASELEELVGWFERDASAYDVATIASNEDIRDGYRQFRAKHIDAFSPKDVLRAIAFVSIIGGLLLMVVWLAP